MRSRARLAPERDERPWQDRVPVGALGALETLLLGLAAAILVQVAIPSAFGIESSCVGASGVQRTGGDTYVGGFVVLGTFGWLGVFLGMIYASIAERRSLVVLLPLLWFVAFVLAALTVAALLGPEPCPR